MGTSKFLHFTFPETFPIWDSRVEKATRYENGIYKNKNDYRTRNINNYIAYWIAVHDIIKNDKAFVITDLFSQTSISKAEKVLVIIASGKNTKNDLILLNQYIGLNKDKVLGWFFLEETINK